MHIISMLIVGLIVGALAKLLLPGRHNHSIVLTMLLGVAGSVVAGFIGHAVGWYRSPGDGPGIIASTVGAMMVLGVYHAVVHRTDGGLTTRRW